MESIFLNKKSEFLGIRDLYYEDNYIFISVIEKEVKGHTLNIYRAIKNFKQLNFEIFLNHKNIPVNTHYKLVEELRNTRTIKYF